MSRKKDNTMKKLKHQFAEKFPFRHVVIPERGEVWIKGSYPGCMAVAFFDGEILSKVQTMPRTT